MVTFSKTIGEVENRLTRLVNEAIRYKFGINGGDRRIRPTNPVIDPSAASQTYYFRDEAIYNKGPWKDFVDYYTNGRLATNTTPQKLFQNVDKAILDGDVIVKLVDTPGQVIDWEDLRGWHYHSPGDKFNDEFDRPRQWGSDDKDPDICVCFYSGGGDYDEMMEMNLKLKISKNTMLTIKSKTISY